MDACIPYYQPNYVPFLIYLKIIIMYLLGFKHVSLVSGSHSLGLLHKLHFVARSSSHLSIQFPLFLFANIIIKVLHLLLYCVCSVIVTKKIMQKIFVAVVEQQVLKSLSWDTAG